MNSVPAVCSPAYIPQNDPGPFWAWSGTRSRSYSGDGLEGEVAESVMAKFDLLGLCL